MLPITFLATAFGLMMEKVRSIAMITSVIVLFTRQAGVKLAPIIMSNVSLAYGSG
ncbi:hypothetical protein GCM10011513_31790 [Franconibacter daqui]|nr:hypothetical protein GCM10011513_31790 [Franconibacter daqui]